MKPANLFENIPGELPDELFDRLAGNERVTIERIVSRGHTTPEGEWFDQERDEWVMLLQGRARLQFEMDKSFVDMRPGDHITIPAHLRHRVAWTDEEGDTIWLAVHY